MSKMMKVHVVEANFHEDLLPGREVELNLSHVRLIVHDKDSSLLFFQNEECLRVRPRLNLAGTFPTELADPEARGLSAQ